MDTTLFGDPIKFVSSLAPPSASSQSPAIVSTSNTNAVSPNIDERNEQGQTNTPIYATGLGATANTGLKKSNQTLSHACDSSTYVGGMVYQAGAFGGKIIQAIRDGIKVILEFFGVNPASSALSNKLKKLAQYIKDKIKYIKDITDAINGYLLYVKKIQELIAFILSLPAQLIAYFKDCITTLQKQLVAGFKSALSDTGTDSNGLSDSIKEVQGAIKDLNASVTTLTTTAATAVATTVSTVAATQAAFSSAGFGPTKGNFSKA
jgi:uncharacterized protein YoxC